MRVGTSIILDCGPSRPDPRWILDARCLSTHLRLQFYTGRFFYLSPHKNTFMLQLPMSMG